ncbi:hypothetical protein HY025_04740 [Candidatus Daviesbacteria bacterium]|nr:hypothetical protein [Candidatus Daviesbacteria bacterium]
MIEKLIPCPLDPTQDCPTICPLRDFSEEVVAGLISFTNPQNPGLGVRESLTSYGSKGIRVNYRLSQFKSLHDLIPVETCHYYPNNPQS